MAGNPGDATRAYNRMQRARAVEGLWARSPNWVRQGVLNAPWRAREMVSGLGGLGRQAMQMNNRFGSMLGLGRFAPLGLPGMAVAGAGMAAIQFGQMGNEGMPSRFSDISRFQPGDDRYFASRLKQTWAPSGQKAPLSFIDRMFVEGRRANQGEPTFLERSLKSAGENYQQLATTTGQASAGDFDAIMAMLRNLNPATALGLPDVFTTLRRLSM